MARARPPSRREVGRALVAAVRADGATLREHVDRHGTDLLERAARRHGVEGLLDLSLHAVGASTPSSTAARVGAAVHHTRTRAQLEQVADVLEAADVPQLVVKGPVLAGHHYERPDLRRYVDLDVLVAPEDFPRALEALVDDGFSVFEDDWASLREVLAGELRLLRGDSVVDLHWTLVDDSAARSRCRLPTEALFAAHRLVPVGGRSVPTTGVTDTVLHVALHAALSGAARLVWLVDLDRVVRRDEPDWDEVLREALPAGLAAQLGVVLARGRRAIGTPVPPEVLRRLGPGPAWGGLVLAVDRWSPVGTARTDSSVARLVARATRESSLSSWEAVVAKAVTRAGHGGRTAPTNSRSRGRDHGREDYLRAVLAER
ncbi:MAG: nucleotidyltransferase family protein [Motilibacteraceae bacterium]